LPTCKNRPADYPLFVGTRLIGSCIVEARQRIALAGLVTDADRLRGCAVLNSGSIPRLLEKMGTTLEIAASAMAAGRLC